VQNTAAARRGEEQVLEILRLLLKVDGIQLPEEGGLQVRQCADAAASTEKGVIRVRFL